MSTHLTSYADSIPLGYTLLQTQNTLVGNLVSNGWQLLAQVDGVSSDVIPPSSETIGTTKFREVVRIYFPDNVTIKIGSYQACIANAFGQSILLTAKTAGAVAAAVTIDGATVTGATGSAGSTANDNLRALFYALKDSANATIMGWEHWYNGTDTIISTNKTITTSKTCSGNANVTYSEHGAPVPSGARSGFVNVDVNYAYPVTIDLTNGFVYYMQVDARSFSLSTKCLSGKYGPVFATYIDHAQAVAALPNTTLCTPIELFVGDMLTTRGAGSIGGCRTTHWWGIGTLFGTKTVPSSEVSNTTGTYDGTPDWHSFSGAGFANTVFDTGLAYCNLNGGQSYADEMSIYDIGLFGSGGWVESHKVIPVAAATYGFSASPNRQSSVRFCPRANFDDLFKWCGVEPDEASAMTTLVPIPGINGAGITLQQALDAGTTYGSILLSTTTGLPSSGGLVIGIEEFTYTGTSGGNTITGVTRSVNGTVGARHFTGDTVSPVQWFLRVNYGAINFGSVKPS